MQRANLYTVVQLSIMAGAKMAWKIVAGGEVDSLWREGRTRSALKGNLLVPGTPQSHYRRVAKIWNVLPEKIREATTLKEAKVLIKENICELESIFSKKFDEMKF